MTDKPAEQMSTENEETTEKTSKSPTDTADNSLDTILANLDEDGRKAVMRELERARGDAAKYRTKASKYGDIDPEKARQAIEKLEEIEAASKSAEEREKERSAALQKERDAAHRELWRERVGRKHQLPDTFLSMVQGNTEEEMQEHGKQIAEELSELKKRPADSVPGTTKSTHTPGAGESEKLDFKKIAAEAMNGL